MNCPNDSKIDNIKYVYTPNKSEWVKVKAPADTTATCPYKEVPLQEGEIKRNVDYLWYKMAWDKTRNSKVDLRLYYATRRYPNTWTKCRWDPANSDYPYFFRFAALSENFPLCYSSDALKYA